MRPQRQVKRAGARPNYARRDQPVRRSAPRGPRLKIGWVRPAIIALALVVIMGLVSSATRLQKITISGQQSLDGDHLTRVAEEGARRQWFGGNTLLLNTGALQNYIEQAEPGVRQAKVSRSGLHQARVVVNERQPSLNWKSGAALYLLDSDGTVIGESRGVYVKLPVVIDSNSLPVKVGDRVAPTAFVSFTTEFVGKLAGLGLVATEITVPASTSELYIKTNQGYTLKLDTTRSAAGEIEDLQAVKKELARAKKLPADYIDLRIENKAYYK